MDSGWVFKNCSDLIYFTSPLKTGWGDQNPQVTWVWSWAHLIQSILPYSLILWTSSNAMDAFTVWQCPGTCGALLRAHAVPGCCSSRKAAGKCLVSNTCEMLPFLLLFEVIYAASHLFCWTCCALQQTPLKVLWGHIDLRSISCVLGGRQGSYSGEQDKPDHLFGWSDLVKFIWTPFYSSTVLNWLNPQSPTPSAPQQLSFTLVPAQAWWAGSGSWLATHQIGSYVWARPVDCWNTILSGELHGSPWSQAYRGFSIVNSVLHGSDKTGRGEVHSLTYTPVAISLVSQDVICGFSSTFALIGRLFNSGTADSKRLWWFCWQNTLLLLRE